MRGFVKSVAAVASLFALFVGLSFFTNLRATLVDYSGYGVVWPLQLFHNMVNDRIFQHSLFSSVYGGAAAGFIGNPFPYIHGFAIHVNVLPFFLVPLWARFPSVTGLYGLLYAWNIVLGLWFTRSILRRAATEDVGFKVLFASAIFIGGGLLILLSQMGQMLLFAGPLILAAYDRLQAGRRVGFFLAMVGLCLVSEDAAMVAAAFSFYVFIWEKDRRVFGRDGFLFSAVYIVLVLMVIQPAARADLIQTDGTTTAAVTKCLFRLTVPVLKGNLASFMPVIPYIPAFALAAILFGWPARDQVTRVAALALVPSLLHWGESVVVGGAHHLGPPLFTLHLSLLAWLNSARINQSPKLFPGGALVAGAFFMISALANAPNMPAQWKPALYRWMGNPEKAELRARGLGMEKESNMAVIRVARTLPPDKSLVYWVNKRVPGFLACRSDVWQFPDYFDRADYLLLQKDAEDLFYLFDAGHPGNLREAIGRGRLADERVAPMNEAAWRRLVDVLVYRDGTHRVVVDDAHVLLLERRERYSFVSPPQTVGMGWVSAIFKQKGAR